jgi:hypothetical protein
VRPLSWIVTATSVAVMLVGARGLARRRVPPAPSPEPTDEKPQPALHPRVPMFQPAPLPPAAPPHATGLAHLRGRVIPPAGTRPAELDELTVTADDGEHEYEAETSDTGQFELHLPARPYTLTASAKGLVGTALVRARPGTEEVTITLEPGVSIEGVARTPAGSKIDLEVSATRSGTGISAGEDADVVDGRFALEGLSRGKSYDVSISGPGLRTVVLRNVRAPGTVEVELSPKAVLHGAIGFPAGSTCPIEHVSISEPTGERKAVVDHSCRFSFDELEPGAEVELRASGGGWHLETRLRIPERGEPDPVCLNPPCRDLPPEPPVDLKVILTGRPDRASMRASIDLDDGGRGCGGDDGECDLVDLTAGEVQLSVQASGCAEVERTVILKPGHNVVTVACAALRLVEGIARRADTRPPAVVWCKNGEHANLQGKSVFELHCPRDATEILYRTGGRPAGHAALPPSAGPAFVELTL